MQTIRVFNDLIERAVEELRNHESKLFGKIDELRMDVPNPDFFPAVNNIIRRFVGTMEDEQKQIKDKTLSAKEKFKTLKMGIEMEKVVKKSVEEFIYYGDRLSLKSSYSPEFGKSSIVNPEDWLMQKIYNSNQPVL